MQLTESIFHFGMCYTYRKDIFKLLEKLNWNLTKMPIIVILYAA